MEREEDQQLWDLLGRRRGPELSPFFARNVIRAIRQQPTWPQRLAGWLRPRRLIPAAAVAVALTGASLALLPKNGHNDENLRAVVAQIDPEDYEAIVDLDDLLASEEDSLWTDTSPL